MLSRSLLFNHLPSNHLRSNKELLFCTCSSCNMYNICVILFTRHLHLTAPKRKNDFRESGAIRTVIKMSKQLCRWIKNWCTAAMLDHFSWVFPNLPWLYHRSPAASPLALSACMPPTPICPPQLLAIEKPTQNPWIHNLTWRSCRSTSVKSPPAVS